MARQITLADGSHIILGGPGSGKTHWALESWLAQQQHALYIDFNKAGYRAMSNFEIEDRRDVWVKGPWYQVRKKVVMDLIQTKKAMYAPSTPDDVQEVAQFFRDMKEKNLENIENIWIYCDEVDLYSKPGSSVEQMWTKDRGAGVRPVGILQRAAQAKNLNIVNNSFGGVLVFRVETGEAQKLRNNYGLEFSEEDLAYIQSVPYSAIYMDLKKYPRGWERI